MGVQSRVAVILLSSGGDPAQRPTKEQIEHWFHKSPYSVTNFWKSSTYGYFTFPVCEVFGWYNIRTSNTTKVGSQEFQQLGRDILAWELLNQIQDRSLADFDRFVVIVYPGVYQDTDGELKDHGMNAIGNTCNLLWQGRGLVATHSLAAHEFGHLLGFTESHGMFGLGGGVNYGDPYDVMSAASYGFSNPLVNLQSERQEAPLPGNPSAWLAGPMPSRASLYYKYPQIMETGGVAYDYYEKDDHYGYTNLSRAGSNIHGQLICFHPNDSINGDAGRIFVEFRGPNPLQREDSSVWDMGLFKNGDPRCSVAVTVYTIVSPFVDNVYYAGHIPYHSGQHSIAVETPLGKFFIELAMDGGRNNPQVVPDTVGVRIRRERNPILEIPPLYVELERDLVIDKADIRIVREDDQGS